jgi:hypothetical protein
MAYEAPHLPTKEEIIRKAIELFHAANPQLPTITPEESELKESSFFERARAELMSGTRSMLEQYLSQLESEADKVREDLGIEKPLPTSERLTELEDKLARVEDRYKTTKERLKETEEELRKIHEAKPPPPVVPLPALPPPIPTGLTEEHKKLLEDLFKSTFIEAEASYAGKLSEFRVELERLQEDLKNESRLRAYELAQREIIRLAKSLIPYKPPAPFPPPAAIPVRVPITAVPIRVAIAEERIHALEERMCIVCRGYFSIDLDLMRRVSEGTTEMRGVGRVRQELPILEFPERFYHMCPSCSFEQFGYRGIYDALAYLLAEATRSNFKKIKLTKDKLRAAGLDKMDLDEIQTLEARYRVSSS